MLQKLDIKKLRPILIWCAIGTMILSFGLVEYVNYITTAESLTAMFGMDAWIVATALSMVIIDISALVLIFIPEGAGKVTPVMKVLLAIWACVSGLDMLLSWYFAALRMESTVVQAPSAMNAVIWIMPIAIAFMLWGVQTGMLYTLGQLLGGNRQRSTMALRVPERG